REYGVDDIPLIVQDKKFHHGRLDERPRPLRDIGLLGDTVAVNGTIGGYLDVTTERIRLRLLNGSTTRTFNFVFSDDRPFALIGTVGGVLPAPYLMNRIVLSPAERAEIVVELRPGERPVLRGYPMTIRGVFKRFTGAHDRFDILQLRAADRLRPRPPLPARLVAVPRLDPDAAATVRELRLAGQQINGRSMDLG